MKITNNTKFYFYGFFSAVIIVTIVCVFGISYLKNYQSKKVEQYVSKETDMLSIDLFYISSSNFNSFKPVSLKNDKVIDLKVKRFTFINFWATWCAPCVGELPVIEKLMSDHKIRQLPVNFIFVNDEDITKQKEFTNKRKLDLNFCFFKDKLPPEFEHNSIPATYIVDNKLGLIYQINGSQNWNSKLIKEFIQNINKN